MRARVNLPGMSKNAMDREIRRQLAEYNEKNDTEIDSMVLYILHNEFGFGEKRLKRFHDSFIEELKNLQERYLMEDADIPWLCTRKLKDAGIDISKWS